MNSSLYFHCRLYTQRPVDTKLMKHIWMYERIALNKPVITPTHTASSICGKNRTFLACSSQLAGSSIPYAHTGHYASFYLYMLAALYNVYITLTQCHTNFLHSAPPFLHTHGNAYTNTHILHARLHMRTDKNSYRWLTMKTRPIDLSRTTSRKFNASGGGERQRRQQVSVDTGDFHFQFCICCVRLA